ncbi:MAG: sodium:proton antiporter, partial [Bacteroidales bacterium]|nr:sodium:proton antiporter [Bacteroidales bacterium]
PAFILSFFLKGELSPLEDVQKAQSDYEKSFGNISTTTVADCITPTDKKIILILGVAALIFVPIFKSITHLPPFVGVLLGLGVIWVYTEFMYHRKRNMEEHMKHRITRVLSHIDLSTILFFLGILLAVAALQCAGILNDLNIFLDTHVGNIYIINVIIGAISSIVDNVPLVAGAVGMYPLADVGVFAQDGVFWLFLAYCAGVGGSMLIIGSAAGVMAMGLEKINFIWYLKHISWLALVGYLVGALVFVIQEFILSGGVLPA